MSYRFLCFSPIPEQTKWNLKITLQPSFQAYGCPYKELRAAKLENDPVSRQLMVSTCVHSEAAVDDGYGIKLLSKFFLVSSDINERYDIE